MTESQNEHSRLGENLETQTTPAEAASIGQSTAMTESQSEHSRLEENLELQTSTTQAASIEPSRGMTETQSEHGRLEENLDTQTSATQAANSDQVHSVNNSLDHYVQQCSSLQKQLAEKDQELETLRAEKDKEVYRKKGLDKRVFERSTELSVVHTELKSLKSSYDHVKGSLDEAKNLNDEKDKQIRSIEEAFQSLEGDYKKSQGACKRLQDSVNEQSIELSVAHTELESTKSSYTLVKGSLDEAKGLNDNKDKHIQSVEKELRESKEAHEKSQTTCKLFQDRVRKQKRELEDQKKLNEEHLQKLADADQQAEKYRNEIENLQRQLKTAENFFELPDGSLKDTKEHIQELENARNHFKECGDGLQGDIDKLQEVLDEKNSQIDEQDIKIHQISNELKSIKRQAATTTETIGVQTDPVPLALVDNNTAAEDAASKAATSTQTIGVQTDPVPLALVDNNNATEDATSKAATSTQMIDVQTDPVPLALVDNHDAAESTTSTAATTTTTIGIQTDPIPLAMVAPTEKQPSWLMYLQENPVFQLLGLILIGFLLGMLLSTSPQQGWDAHQMANSKAVRLGAQITSGYARQVMQKTPSALWMAPEDVMKIAAALKSGLGEGASGLH